jgi:hypothetical protein
MPKNQRPLVAAVLHYDRIEDWDGRGNPGKFSVAIADREHVEKFLPTIAGWKYRDLVEVVEDPGAWPASSTTAASAWTSSTPSSTTTRGPTSPRPPARSWPGSWPASRTKDPRNCGSCSASARPDHERSPPCPSA